MLASICAVSSWILLPTRCTLESTDKGSIRGSTKEIIKKLDLIGVFLIMASLLLFNLALTSKSCFNKKKEE